MNSLFYPKLAGTNLRKNAKTYLPYLFSGVCTVMTFYAMLFIANNPGLRNMPGAETLPVFFNLGAIIIGIFSTILLFYTNSFLIKRRKKELGLYCILGMEKRHIAKVLFFEVFYTAGISIILGLLAGMLISKLLYMALLNILNLKVSIVFEVSGASVMVTVILFLVIFFLTLLSNLWQIKIANPITLLHGGAQGEKEPKTKWVLAIIGFIMLGAGYAIAITVESPMDALALFFIAVVAVIIGTYCLFVAGSIAVLKLLKKNKRFYYRPNNFISVSGMIYRMKQNAAGLASICILSTMVLVTVSTTLSLFIGQEDILRERYPRNYSVTFYDRTDDSGKRVTIKEQQDAFEPLLNNVLSTYDVTQDRRLEYWSVSLGAMWKDQALVPAVQESIKNGLDFIGLTILPLDDYNRMEGTDFALKAGECMVFFNGNGAYGKDTIAIGGMELKVAKELGDFSLGKKSEITLSPQYIVVVKDIGAGMEALRAFYPANTDMSSEGFNFNYYTGFDIQGDSQTVLDAAEALNEQVKAQLPEAFPLSVESIRQEWYTLYGGFFFLGIFLGTLFIMATVLIIYYKQISEGYDDHDRFEIMQKVGMSKKEVKRTIHKQVLMIFFLPLAVAVIHVVVAFNVIKRLLFIFGLTNITLFAVCTAATVLVFALIYMLVYFVTAKAYYNLIEQK